MDKEDLLSMYNVIMHRGMELVLGAEAAEFAQCKICKTLHTNPMVSVYDLISVIRNIPDADANKNYCRLHCQEEYPQVPFALLPCCGKRPLHSDLGTRYGG